MPNIDSENEGNYVQHGKYITYPLEHKKLQRDKDLEQVHLGDMYNCSRTRDQKVWKWGKFSDFKLNNTDVEKVKVNESDYFVDKVAVGYKHCLAITKGGIGVTSWGIDGYKSTDTKKQAPAAGKEDIS